MNKDCHLPKIKQFLKDNNIVLNEQDINYINNKLFKVMNAYGLNYERFNQIMKEFLRLKGIIINDNQIENIKDI